MSMSALSPGFGGRLAGWVALACLLATACGGGEGTSNAPKSSSEPAAKVRIGFLYDVFAAPVWTLPDCTSKHHVDVEMVNFKQYADVQRALQAGQIDFGAMGYQNAAQMLDANFTDWRMVVGVQTGAEHISLRKGFNAKSWTDLAGHKVGIPPNSFVSFLFKYQASRAGLNLSSVQIVDFPGAGPPMLSALQRGDIDAMVAWEPNSANAAAQGIGEYAKNFDLQDGPIGKATSVMYATKSIIDSNPSAVQRVVNCVIQQDDYLTKNQGAFVDDLTTQTGMTKQAAQIAVKQGELDYKIYVGSGQQIIKLFADARIMSDQSAKIPQYAEFKFLEKATGKPASQLGG